MKLFIGLMILAASGVAALAQEPRIVTTPQAAVRVFSERAVSSERAVKNSPFSAEAVSESVQTLADGNRIVHSSTTKLYRNSEGRTRREMANGSGGLPGMAFSYSPGVTITDPAGGSVYMLNDKLKLAEQALTKASMDIRVKDLSTVVEEQGTMPAEKKALLERMQTEGKVAVAATPGLPPLPAMPAMPMIATTGEGMFTYSVGGGARTKYETKTEQLGVQNIEGVEAEGTRTTTIIPAGAIGNERPIETVYERWYSKDLQLVVMSKHTDPRFGEQTYRLTNIVRSEPDPSLFSLPTGYKVRTEPGSTYRVAPAKADAERAVTVKAAQAPKAIKN